LRLELVAEARAFLLLRSRARAVEELVEQRRRLGAAIEDLVHRYLEHSS
jgi:hypothetical protein